MTKHGHFWNSLMIRFGRSRHTRLVPTTEIVSCSEQHTWGTSKNIENGVAIVP